MGVVAKGDLLPLLAMVLVQLVYAGMNITSKLALDSGMKPLILVAYRQLFATLAMLPLAYFFEWKTLPKITKSLLVKIFICSLVGATGNQVLFYVGLQNSTPTIGCALANILPAITFILAVVFRQESVGIKRLSGQAKVLGTILCVVGAMLLSFYHGHMINIGQSSIDWKFADQMEDQAADHKSNPILGSLLIMASSVSWACWFVLQAKVSRDFPATITSALLMCSFGSIECMVIGISAHHKVAEEWSLRSPTRLVTVLYAGIVSTGIGYSVTCWTIRRKGALYVSVFNPLLLVIVAVLSWALLREKLYVGSIIGSLLIVAGLYGVIWGKNREAKVLMTTIEEEKEDTTKLAEHKEDLELQLPAKDHHDDASDDQAAK